MDEFMSNMRIKVPAQIPYGGQYTVKAPEKGIVGTGINFEALMDAVKVYRRANALPITLSLEDEVEKLVCEAYPVECHETDPTVPVKRKLTMSDVANGTEVMLAHLAAGSPLVSPEVANARAAICLACPMRVEFGLRCGGGLCGKLLELVAKSIVGAPNTQFDEDLKNKSCGICSCYLRVAAWVPLENQCPGLSDAQKKLFDAMRVSGVQCWKKC